MTDPYHLPHTFGDTHPRSSEFPLRLFFSLSLSLSFVGELYGEKGL